MSKDTLVQDNQRLGIGGLIALMVITPTVGALCTDMYTPAVPSLVVDLNSTPAVVNMTLLCYFVAQSCGLLAFGPVSDRTGRKPIFLGGAILFTVASIACALSGGIETLIVARVFEAIGSGAMAAMSTAVVKDAIRPEKREQVLAVVVTMFVVGPVAAPVIGSLILQVATWRMTFVVLAAVGVVCLILSLIFTETLPVDQRTHLPALQTMGRLGSVLTVKGFTIFLLVSGMFAIPFFAYLSVASYVYINHFQVGEVGYGLFFAASALISGLAPMLWVPLSKRTTPRKVTTVFIIVCLITGFVVLAAAERWLWCFFITFTLFASCQSLMRPYVTNILLSQHERDTGSASSVIQCSYNVIGCVGMGLVVLPWPSFTTGLGALMVGAMAVAGALWFFLLRSNIPLIGIKDAPTPPAE